MSTLRVTGRAHAISPCGCAMSSNQTMKTSDVDDVCRKVTASNSIHEAVIFVENANGDFSYLKKHGGKDLDSPLLMASITKLFTTACVFALREQGKLSLDDGIAKYFDDAILSGLHVYRHEEYSFALTISDLLFQTSGLPDAYEEGTENFKVRAVDGDFRFSFNDVMETTKRLKPHFPPHTEKRAYYADVNFDILGEILERVTGWPLSRIYRHFIFEPLGFGKTYLPEGTNDFVPIIYYGNRAIRRPGFVMSSRASGGCVTTAREMMTFLKAFFGGTLFDRSIFDVLSSSNRLQASMWPIWYGAGHMRIPLNGVITLFKGRGELRGHAGSTGSFAFQYPANDLYIVGDLNQMANHALPIRMSMQIAMRSGG